MHVTADAWQGVPASLGHDSREVMLEGHLTLWKPSGYGPPDPVPLGFTVALSAGVAVEVSVWSSPVSADCSLTSQGPTLPLPGQLIRLPSIL